MPVISKVKTLEFNIGDEAFIKQLSKDIGCYYSMANEHTYNLNKNNTDVQSERGVFAWVHKENDDTFWISTRKTWVDEARGQVLASRKSSGINCFPRDTKRAADSVSFDTKENYFKTVSVLKLINKMR